MNTVGITVVTLLLGVPVLAASTSAIPLPADAPAEEGERIFAEVSRRDAGYGDQQAIVSMQLKRKSGAPTSRLMEIAILEVPDDGTRTIVGFNNPLDVKGTKVLTYSHAARDDEQWIYLPAFKRVKQIADASKTTSFMGSEFTYEDLNSLNIQVPKFSYRFLKTEDLDGTPCFVVERTPRYARSAYKRQVVWIDQRRYVVNKIDYYDTKDALVKTLMLAGFHQYADTFWRAGEMNMTNHQTGDSTQLTWSGYKFKNGLSAGEFSTSALTR
jgi:outer membrane lipoprotein-sorting protein